MMSKSNESKKRGVVGQVKVKKEEPEMDDDNLAPPPPAKRGPGRPRRAERAGEREANPYINDDNMAPLGKRGRGRPRRPAQAGENGVSSQHTPQAKRGRGRPRRVVEDGNGGSRDTPPAKRGRGRPKREVKAEEGELNIRHGPPADCVAGRTRSQFQKWNIKIEKEEEANTEENEPENQKVAKATMAPVPFHGNVEEEDSDDEDPRNDVEGEGPGMHELVSDTEEEDNKESVSDAFSVQVDPRTPALSPTSEPPAANERKSESPLKVEENVIDGVADASVNPTPASSAHNAFDEDKDIASPANNRSLPEFPAVHGSLRFSKPVTEAEEKGDHFVEGAKCSDDIGNLGYADDVEHLTSPARLVSLKTDPVCRVTGQVVTVTRSPPCFFADTVMLCQLCNKIYEERQKRHEELYQIVSKFF